MRLNVGTYRINVPNAASFDEVEVIAAQQIKDADAKLAEVKINLIATAAAPSTVARGKTLKITYEIECSDDVAEDTAKGIWLGASIKDTAGKLFFNTSEDRATALTKGKQTRERNFTIAQDAPLGDQKLETGIWRGAVGDSTKSKRICGTSVPITVIV